MKYAGIEIPKKMGNEESQRVAGVVVEYRNAQIANAKLYAARNQLKKFYDNQ